MPDGIAAAKAIREFASWQSGRVGNICDESKAKEKKNTELKIVVGTRVLRLFSWMYMAENLSLLENSAGILVGKFLKGTFNLIQNPGYN